MRCVVCEGSIDLSDRPQRMVFTPPNGDTEYDVHDECWRREGLGEVEWPAVAMAYYRARQEPSLWAALESFDRLVHGSADFASVHGAIVRLVRDFE